MLLEGKKALITGARKGIGRGIAIRMAEEGAAIGLNDILDDDVTRQTAALVQERGGQGTLHIFDVSTLCGINQLVEDFLARHGRIDIIVNNAIFADQSRPLFDTDEVFWDRIMNLTLKGYFFASQRAARAMVEQGDGGRIICLSSLLSYRGFRDWTAYGTAKAGLRRMVKGFAVDLAGTGITANCIAPGYINNRLPDQGIEVASDDLSDRPAMKARVPAQRGGVPSDIAGAALFLASDMGSYVNGQTILVDGGVIATSDRV